MAEQYDVVVIGDGALAAGVAWALTSSDPDRRVGVLAPSFMAEGWDPARLARLHALRTPAALTSLVPRSAVRYRAWADELGLEPPRVRGGMVALATTIESRARLRAAAAAVPSCRAITEEERLELVEGHDPAVCLAGWHEPLATTMAAADLVFRLTEAAATAGADVVDEAAVASVTATASGYDIVTVTGARTRATTVIDLDPALAVSRAAGLTGTVLAPTHQRLATEAMGPLLSVAVTVDDVVVSQRPSGELDLLVPIDNPLGLTGLEAAADAVARVIRALPRLGGAPITSCRSHDEAVSLDGLPIVGELAPGLWTCGGLGRHHDDLVPLLAESLAAAVGSGRLDDVLAPFAPQRQLARRAAVLPSAPRWSCSVCGPRQRREFTLAGGRLVHVAGCGRALGSDSTHELVIDLRQPVPTAAPEPSEVDSIDLAGPAAEASPVAAAVELVGPAGPHDQLADQLADQGDDQVDAEPVPAELVTADAAPGRLHGPRPTPPRAPARPAAREEARPDPVPFSFTRVGRPVADEPKEGIHP